MSLLEEDLFVMDRSLDSLALEMGWEAEDYADRKEALARIRAALADREHLEEGARLFVEWASFRGFDDSGRKEREVRIAAWLAAEAKRKEQTNG